MSPVPEIVLVVDDDAAVRAALKFVLEVEGFRVRLYDSPEAVLDDPELPTRACLVVDYRMPRIDGIELIERLRERQVALPAILISARVNKQLRRLAERIGLVGVLEKPLSDAALVDSIRSALGPAPPPP
ncbi:MAG: response regulator [Rhodospirillales bacterium]|nr:response regulator [Rhodospirillales bacterium]